MGWKGLLFTEIRGIISHRTTKLTKYYMFNLYNDVPRHRGLGGKYSLSIYSDEKVEGSNPGVVILFLLLLFGF